MKRIEHREAHFNFPFVEYSPTNTKKGLPLIIQLHGAGERGCGGDDLALVDIHGFSKLLKDAEYDCLFIMPQCPSDSFWAAKVESILGFIEQIAEEYSVDRNRIYLTGLSMGGYGTWFTAMAKPEIFAAIAPVCGGGMAWNAGVLDMPVWAFHGANDPVVSPSQSDEMVNKLMQLEKNVRYTRLDGVAHNAWEHAYNHELVSWLLEQKK